MTVRPRVPEPVRSPLTTKLSQNTLTHLPEHGVELQGPVPCDSPSAGHMPEQEDWPGPSIELVTYELELDTGSCKVNLPLAVVVPESAAKPGLPIVFYKGTIVIHFFLVAESAAKPGLPTMVYKGTVVLHCFLKTHEMGVRSYIG